MRITTKVILDIETLAVISRESYEYSGPVDILKKGRERVEKNMEADAAAAKQQRGNEQAAYGQAQSNLAGDNNMGPTGMTSAATAQLAADNDNINRVYNGLRQQSFRTLGARGFGNAPSGFGLAAQNGLAQGQEQADTGAFRNAQIRSQDQKNFATQEEGKLSGQEGGLGGQSSGESTNAAVARSHMGSTLGDIMGGISQVAGAVVPGISAVQGFAKAFKKIGSPSGVGAYDSTGTAGGGSGQISS